jgi:hypothetical protein
MLVPNKEPGLSIQSSGAKNIILKYLNANILTANPQAWNLL